MARKKDDHEDPHKDLVKQLTDNYHFRPSELLGWMLEEVLCKFGALQERTCKEEAKPIVEGCVRAYLRAVQLNEPFTDVLGSVYMTLASRWGQKALGQYFTPQPIARMMAQMTYDGLATPADGRLLRTCDPACGSGVMMLAFLQTVIEREGPAGLLRWSVTGIDIDVTCARMCAVQLLVNCMVHEFAIGEIVVMRGDSLSSRPLAVVAHAAAKAETPDNAQPERGLQAA